MKLSLCDQSRLFARIKTVGLSAIAVCILITSSAMAIDYYKVRGVKRIDQDIYKSYGGLYIETQYCYHYSYGEDVILKWEGTYGNNLVIWKDDSTCQVKGIWSN